MRFSCVMQMFNESFKMSGNNILLYNCNIRAASATSDVHEWMKIKDGKVEVNLNPWPDIISACFIIPIHSTRSTLSIKHDTPFIAVFVCVFLLCKDEK